MITPNPIESPRGKFLIAWLLVAGVIVAQSVVNAFSAASELKRFGSTALDWEPWTWEFTSAASWVILTPLIFRLAIQFRPPSTTLVTAVAAHAAISIPVSFAHVGIMMMLRHVTYFLAGVRYHPAESLTDMLVFEYRKDVLTYALVVAFMLLFEQVAKRALGREAVSGEPRIAVKERQLTRWIDPQDIEWAEAAGNYVEIHGSFGTVLHRESLVALHSRLATSDFVRIHRSKVVRKAAIATVHRRASGDFRVVTASGACLNGSRRYRAFLKDNAAS